MLDLDEVELGYRVQASLAIENSSWAYKFYWMSPAYWWDEDSGTFIKETREEFLQYAPVVQSGQGRQPLKLVTRVRIPLGVL